MAVTWAESFFRRLHLEVWRRPVSSGDIKCSCKLHATLNLSFEKKQARTVTLLQLCLCPKILAAVYGVKNPAESPGQVWRLARNALHGHRF